MAAAVHATSLVKAVENGFAVSCSCGWSETSPVLAPLKEARRDHRYQITTWRSSKDARLMRRKGNRR